jgi:hypothetical protein
MSSFPWAAAENNILKAGRYYPSDSFRIPYTLTCLSNIFLVMEINLDKKMWSP